MRRRRSVGKGGRPVRGSSIWLVMPTSSYSNGGATKYEVSRLCSMVNSIRTSASGRGMPGGEG